MLLRSLPCFVALWLPFLAANAQNVPLVSPSNATSTPPTNPDVSIILSINAGGMGVQYNLTGLTPNATSILQYNAQTQPDASIQGNLQVVGTNNDTIGAEQLPLVSCDAPAGMLSLDDIVNSAAQGQAPAVVFYSLSSEQCNLTGTPRDNFLNLYTLTSLNASQHIYQQLSNTTLRAAILTVSTQRAASNAGSSGTMGGFGGTTTAVAMIILYSITGVITALFLVIIVTGAVRAHRHPERYGPRNVAGRPRQSRAKGIARAMLETIPIVKFGDGTPTKDVELSDATPPTAATTSHTQADGTTAEHGTAAQQSLQPIVPAAAAAPQISTPTTTEDTSVTCSICTEDFERGQDTRVLPCNHKFHPACVDPWLLDVSGTCPLCRVDLRAADGSGDRGDDGLPPPLDPASDPTNTATSGGRLRGLLRRLQPATAEERIAALRRFREENAQRSHDASGAGQAEEGHATRWERVRRRVGL